MAKCNPILHIMGQNDPFPHRFYTPGWKTVRIMPWQCPSVRPSVGPSAFSGLFFNIFCYHGLINQDKFFKFGTQVACCILLDISSVFFVKILFSEFCRSFLCVLDFSKFSGVFFLHVLRYQFETWYLHAVGGATRQVRVSYQSGHFDLLYSQK